MSHDIRTPLTGAIGSASVLLGSWDKLKDDDRLSLVDGIKEDAEWLLNMVENVLSATRMGGTSMLNIDEHHVEEIVSLAVSKCRSRLSGCSVNIIVPDSLVMVRMDAVLIERVLINLIENAYKYAWSPITVEVEPVQKGMTAVSVSDRGAGIPSDKIEAIFEAGRRNSPDSSRGLGIGLALCKTIVKAYGGEITCRNRDGGGAIFRFTLLAEEG